jgi:threonine dehydrogenase-like Zn-dependent dehydrogenase
VNSSTEDVASRVRELTGGRGFDRAIDAIGLVSPIDHAPEVLARGGRCGLYGVEDAQDGKPGGRISIPAGGEWSLCQIYPAEHLAHDEIISLVRSGKLHPSRYITHRLPLDEINRGFELIREKRAVKVVIEIGAEGRGQRAESR